MALGEQSGHDEVFCHSLHVLCFRLSSIARTQWPLEIGTDAFLTFVRVAPVLRLVAPWVCGRT